jgi:Flp pilus assembly protein TadD
MTRSGLINGGLGLIAFLAVAVYIPSLDNEFVYDDHILIAGNTLFHRLDTIPRLFITDWWKGAEHEIGRSPSEEGGMPTTGDKRYRPFTAVTYVLNYALLGPRPWGYHLVNLLLHAAVSCLVFLLALELGWRAGSALLAGVVFAIHPLHVEAAAWVSSRSELLMSLGVLGGIWCAIRGFRWCSLLAFGLGLLSKEQAVIMPALLLLIESRINPLLRPQAWSIWVQNAFRRYWAYGAVLIAYLVFRTAVLGGFQPEPYPFLENPLDHVQGLIWALSVLKLAGRYLWLSIWPAALSVEYSYNSIPIAASIWEPEVLWGLAAWGGMLGLGLWSWRGDGRISMAIGVTVLSFLPVANLFISVGTPMAERLFYLPLAGLCLLAALGYEAVRRATGDVRSAVIPAVSSVIPALSSVIPAKAGIHLPGPPIKNVGGDGQGVIPEKARLHVTCIVIGLICLALAVRTVLRVQDWQDDQTLFRSAVAVFPNNAKAHMLLGDALRKQSRPDLKQAVAEYREAIRLYPDYLATHVALSINFGSTLMDLGYLDEALEAMKVAALVSPSWSRTHYNLGLVYTRLGQYDQAEQAWREALALAPNDPQTHSSLSRLFIERGRYQEGLEAAESALKRDPEFVMAVYNRALALQVMGRIPDSVAAYERLLLMPNAPEEAKRDATQKLGILRAQSRTDHPRARICMPGVVGC